MSAVNRVFDIPELVDMIFEPLSAEDALCAGRIGRVAANRAWAKIRAGKGQGTAIYLWLLCRIEAEIRNRVS
jgi:hypothetical protein